MHFKDIGNLFDFEGSHGFYEMFAGTFKGYSSMKDMQNIHADSLNKEFKIGTDGLSEFTTAQINAKATALGLTDSLTTELISIGRDATLSQKAATGKLTWGKALDDNNIKIEELGKALIDSGAITNEKKSELDSALKLGGEDLYREKLTNIINDTKDLYDTFIDLGDTTDEAGASLGTYFKGMAATIKPLLPYITAVTAAIAAFEVWDYSQHDYSRAFADAENSAAGYAQTQSSLTNLNSELDITKSRILELQSLQSTGNITFAEEAELVKLTRQNDELERQIGIEQNLLGVKQQAAAQTAKTASETEMSYTEAMQKKHGAPLGTLFGITGKTGTFDPATGMPSTGNTAEQIWMDQYDGDTTIQGQVKGNIQLLEEYQESLKNVQKKLAENPTDKGLLQQQDNLNDKIFETSANLTEQSAILQQWIDQSTDADGNVTKGFEPSVESWNKSLTDIQNIGKSQSEIDSNNLNNFFSSKSGNAIKDALTDIVSKSKNAEDALAKFKQAGLSLDDIGVSREGFIKYFESVADSAKEAESAVKSIDGSIAGVKAAFESENQDADWNSMSDYIKQAQELYENGKIGTDDFKAAAQFMSPTLIDPDSAKYDADAYVTAWEAAQDKIKRYFDADHPANGADNFKNDLISNGLASNENDDITWKFETSAEAAAALGLSVEATEAAMHNLESYGAEFDDVLFSGEGLTRYENALNSIKSLYDSMGEGDSKKRLEGLITGWESELEGYQNDLSSLTEEQIIHLEFEYDLASTQAWIDELKAMQKAQGKQDAITNGSILAVNEEYISDAKDGLGLNNEGIDLSVHFKPAEDAVNNLYSQLQDTESGSDEFFEIQTKIQNAQEIQKDLLNSFSEQHPEINVNSSMDEIAGAWESFFGQEQHFSVEGELDSESIEAQMESLASGSTIKFNIDNSEITALKHEDGTITYTSNVDGANVPVSVTEKDGRVTFEPDPSEVNKWNAPDKPGTSPYYGDFTCIGDPPALFGKVFYSTVGSVVGTSMIASGAASIIRNMKRSAGTLLSPAQADGTAYNMLSLKPAYINGKVALTRDETALVNELGVESIIRNGEWKLLPGKMHIHSLKKGDIVLNAKQTRDLLKSGKTNSHARAYANGTLMNAYANGWRIPAHIISSDSSYSSKVNTKKTTSSAARASNTVSSAANATEDALNALTNYFDWVAENMSRAKRLSEIAKNAIDTAVGLSAKQTYTEEAIRNVQREIEIARQGAEKYLSHAEWFAGQSGLSADLQSLVQNGTIDISKYDDDTQKKIKEYQDWYENYLDAVDKVTDLQEKETKLAIKRLENIEDFYKLVVKVHESLQDANDSALELNDTLGFSAVSDSVKKLIKSSISEAESIYTQKLQQLSDYENEFNNLMSQGYIKEGSDEYHKSKAQLNEFRQSVYDAEVSLIEFSDKLREVEYTKIQQLIDGFERAVDKLDARIDLMESRDETVPESIYQKQLDANNSHISANRNMRNAKLSEQALYAVNSSRYQELAKEISKLDTETLGLMEDNEKLKDTIFELRFTPLEDGIKKMESLRSELGDFMDLLDPDAYFDKQGAITEEGAAALALLEQSMSSSKQEIADYREGLNKLQESFDNGVISETEFHEKSEEYRKGIRDSIKDVHDYSESLTKLYLTQMKQESGYIQEVIDQRKKALKAKEEYYDYDRKISSKSKDINMLQSQIAALEGVNNTSAQAELKRLKQELADAEDDLAETKRDHSIDMQEKGYSAMSDELDEILKNTEYEIIHNSEKQQSVIQSMLQNVVDMYSSAYGKINEIIHNTGWVGSKDFNSNQSSLSTPEGAGNQVSNATQHQSNVGSTSTAQETVTSPINNNDSFNQKFEQEISKDPDTKNRPVAELKLSAKSITLEEGKSTSVSVQIRPADAKNKKLTWKTSNKSVATVSNGTIKAVRPGSCQITASTTDGSGISASAGVTVTKKPEPPKPEPPQQTSTNNGGGDGVPRVGDAVTFTSGRYYYDSEGINPSGNQMLGQTVYITKINNASWARKPYHISRGSSLGNSDLGWVTLDQLRGYNAGARKLLKDELALFDEDKNGKSAPGSEIIITKYGTLKQFDAGDTIFSSEQVRKLWYATRGDGIPFKAEAFYRPENIFDKILQNVSLPDIKESNNNVGIHFDSLLTIEGGTITKDAIPDIEGTIKKSIPVIAKGVSEHMYKNAVMSGVRRKR